MKIKKLNKKGAAPKLLGFFLAMLLIGFVMSLFSTFFTSMSVQYNQSYNESELDISRFGSYMEQASEELEEYRGRAGLEGNESAEPGTDILGFGFLEGIGYIRDSWRSLGMFREMMEMTFNETGTTGAATSQTGEVGTHLLTFFIAAFAAIFVLGILIPALIRWKT